MILSYRRRGTGAGELEKERGEDFRGEQKEQFVEECGGEPAENLGEKCAENPGRGLARTSIRQKFAGAAPRGRQLLLPFEEDHICVVRFPVSERRRSTIWREGKVLYADFGRGGECA
ncbi:MAG: hypothetical protein R6V67_05495 [Spirochaetia bacterium]